MLDWLLKQVLEKLQILENIQTIITRRQIMQSNILEGVYAHVTNLLGKDTIEILEIEAGHIRLLAKVTDVAINMYGGLHGGYLYTLCDTAAGMCAYTHEATNLTQNSSITYLRGSSSKHLYVEANTLHKGRRTVVTRVDIIDDENHLLVTSNFSMFLTGTI